jgi:hypothetical protein
VTDRRRQSLALVGVGLLLLSLVGLLFVPVEKAGWDDDFVQRCGALVGYRTPEDVAVAGDPHPAWLVLVERANAVCSDALAVRKIYVAIAAAALLIALSLLWFRSRTARTFAKVALALCAAALLGALIIDGPVLILGCATLGCGLALTSRRPPATISASVGLEV